MKKTALFTLGLLLATSACFADAKIEVKDVDAAYLQKYVMDNFHQDYPDYVFESRTAEKVVYSEKKSLLNKKKDQVIGKARHEVIFTTVQQGDDVVLGIEQNQINTYNGGNTENTKPSEEIDDKIFLNQYRAFFNDTYSFGFSIDPKVGKEGVAILNVYLNGPMAKAGVTKGSVITAVNGVSVVDNAKAFQNALLPDQFDGAPATFSIKSKAGVKNVVVTPELKECKYTKIKQARARAEKERAEGKRGIESWLKL